MTDDSRLVAGLKNIAGHKTVYKDISLGVIIVK